MRNITERAEKQINCIKKSKINWWVYNDRNLKFERIAVKIAIKSKAKIKLN